MPEEQQTNMQQENIFMMQKLSKGRKKGETVAVVLTEEAIPKTRQFKKKGGEKKKTSGG